MSDLSKVYMPIHFQTINDQNKHEYLYWLKKCGASRVFFLWC